MTEETITDPANDAVQGKAIESAKAVFSGESLRFPFVPDAMIGLIRPLGDRIFGTRDLNMELYALDPFVTELEQRAVDDYLLMGFDGHGISSQALHYFLVCGPLALFLQLTWANPFADEATSRRRIEGALGLAESLFFDITTAVEKGSISPGQRLVVVESDFSTSRWGWTQGTAPLALEEDPSALFVAHMKIREILSQ